MDSTHSSNKRDNLDKDSNNLIDLDDNEIFNFKLLKFVGASVTSFGRNYLNHTETRLWNEIKQHVTHKWAAPNIVTITYDSDTFKKQLANKKKKWANKKRKLSAPSSIRMEKKSPTSPTKYIVDKQASRSSNGDDMKDDDHIFEEENVGNFANIRNKFEKEPKQPDIPPPAFAPSEPQGKVQNIHEEKTYRFETKPMGFQFEAENGKISVRSVLAMSVAGQYGVEAKWDIVAVNGFRDWSSMLDILESSLGPFTIIFAVPVAVEREKEAKPSSIPPPSSPKHLAPPKQAAPSEPIPPPAAAAPAVDAPAQPVAVEKEVGDADEDGRIVASELAQACNISVVEAQNIIAQYDVDGDGKLDPTEFERLKQQILDQQRQAMTDKIAFGGEHNQFDANDDDRVDANELAQSCNVSIEQAQAIIPQYDVDGDGTSDHQERASVAQEFEPLQQQILADQRRVEEEKQTAPYQTDGNEYDPQNSNDQFDGDGQNMSDFEQEHEQQLDVNELAHAVDDEETPLHIIGTPHVSDTLVSELVDEIQYDRNSNRGPPRTRFISINGRVHTVLYVLEQWQNYFAHTITTEEYAELIYKIHMND